MTTQIPDTQPLTIDFTPTWGEWGNFYRRFAESGERAAVRSLSKDFAQAMASTQALKAITHTLTEEQRTIISNTMTAELKKQGF